MKVVSWNCRGVGSRSKEEAMKYLLQISKPFILLVYETKMEEAEFLQASTTFWKKGPVVAASARGASGGIGIVWNSSSFELLASEQCTHWILTTLFHKESGI